MANIELLLIDAGSFKQQFLQMRVYQSGISLWDNVNEIYIQCFGEHKPARYVVPTRELHFGCLIEIEATAFV